MESYKDFIVWKKSVSLCVDIYKATEAFPKNEMYGLVSQMRRACVSIPSNIAEGQRRGHDAEFVQFLHIAFGSGAELETQLYIACNIGYLKQSIFDTLNSDLDEIMRMLYVLIRRMEKKR